MALKLVPFDMDGNLIEYVYNPTYSRTSPPIPDVASVVAYSPRYSVDWRDNFEFDAALKFKSSYRGRSAVHFRFVDIFTGREYNMFLSVMEELLNKKMIDCGVVKGRWTFIKRGANYSIDLVG